jgi:Ca-activated chloride channel homolog
MKIIFEEANILYTAVPIFFGIFLLIFLYLCFTKGVRKAFIKGLPLIIIRSLQCFILLCIVAKPTLIKEIEQSTIPVLIDISESMDEREANLILDKIKKVSSTQQTTFQFIPFAGKGGVPLSQTQDFKEVKRSWYSLDIGRTNLEEGIRSVYTNGFRSVALLSDGYITVGTEESVLSFCKEKGVNIFPFFESSQITEQSSLKIIGLHAPLFVQAESSVDIRVALENSTVKQQTGTLEVRYEDKVIEKKKITLDQNVISVSSVKSDPSKEGIHEITAIFTPDDTRYPASSASTFITGESGEKILLVSSQSDEEKVLYDVLKNQSFKVETLRTIGGSLEGAAFNRYSAVILNNLPFSMLGAKKAEELSSYVKVGGGVAMVGGNRSFGLGGYKGTRIAEMLPVVPLEPRTEQKRINIAVQLVIDKSRSMSDSQKLEYAKEAAKQVVTTLKNDDYIGVIGFDSTPFIVVKLEQLASIREAAPSRIDRLFSAGKTNLLPALDEARRGLERAQAGRKHIIVLTDGKLPDAGSYYVDMARQMKRKGITLSTVMMGGYSSDDTLQGMAEAGGGSFYETPDAASLPRIFLQDIKVNTGEKTLKENSDIAVKKAQNQLYSTQLTRFPDIQGYVEVQQKSEAMLELVAVNGDKNEPLLSTWKYGQGRVTAFTSDVSGRWTGAWLRWGSFYGFWRDIVDSLRKGEISGENARFDVKQYIQNNQLFVEAIVYSEDALSGFRGEMVFPDGSRKPLLLNQAEKGRYIASFDSFTAGKYELHLFSSERKFTPVALYVSGEVFGEVKGKGFNERFLRRLASECRGQVNPDVNRISQNSEKRVQKRELDRYLFYFVIFFLFWEIWRRFRKVRML